MNSSAGVVIEVEGDGSALDRFLLRVGASVRPRAIVQGIESAFLDAVGFAGFEIRESVGGEKTALVLPDVATCPDCLRELRDPANRRYPLPVHQLHQLRPALHDHRGAAVRPAEHDDGRVPDVRGVPGGVRRPADRRFHAQPNACPACGPHLELWDADGACLASRDEALRAAEAADRAAERSSRSRGSAASTSSWTRATRRRCSGCGRRKAREEKPFALMFPSLEAVRAACEVSEREARLLASPEAPIVLLRR